ncbi:MAG: IS3 family transposase [Opitutaceae bacterium]
MRRSSCHLCDLRWREGRPPALPPSLIYLKKALVQHECFKTRDQTRSAIFEWIEVWYQRERSHSSLGYLSPEAFEAARRTG